ncbi:MAG: hypothetical protein K8T10_19945 [Candidatus Eremiobacteraeota bacterium]|nr:hypothetical protein [Candidatus Eremiobacteraeota bacterium]
MTSTFDYIPGSCILGVLAWRYLRFAADNGEPDEYFKKFFISGELIFEPAFFCIEHYDNLKPLVPVPFSFEKEKDLTDPIEVYDRLIINEKSRNILKHIDEKYFLPGKTLIFDSPSRRINFHNARNRVTGTSNDGDIFNYESIEPEMIFEGIIAGNKDDLEKLLEKVGLTEDNKQHSFDIRLGRSKHTQYGKAEFTFLDDPPILFNKNSDDMSFEDDIFTITLISPTILKNENGFSESTPKRFREILQTALGLSKEEIKLESAFSKKVDIENFIGVWRLPRPSETALDKGSCFRFKLSDKTKSKRDEIAASLKQIRQEGIGERSGEGFGRLAVNLQKVEEYQRDNNLEFWKRNNKTPKPPGDMPKNIKSIFDTIIKNELIRYFKSQAETSAYLFAGDKDKIPTNSLLNRIDALIMRLKKEKNKILPEQVKSQVNKLRKPAKDQLKGCKNYQERVNLFNKLSSGSDEIDKMLENIKNRNLERIIERTVFEITQDIKNEIYHRYWQTLLNYLKKTNREVG